MNEARKQIPPRFQMGVWCCCFGVWCGVRRHRFRRRGRRGRPFSAREQPKPPRQEWTFNGFFGRYDQAQLQRGFQTIARFVPTATPSKWWRSAICPTRAAPAFGGASQGTRRRHIRLKTAPNDAGDCSSGPGGRRIISPGPCQSAGGGGGTRRLAARHVAARQGQNL